MNIFYIDNDPQISAICMVDSHVVKMILETAQMLSTAHRIVDNNNSPYMYKATHINHPSTKWARETEGNYIWLVSHFKYLGDEYQYRYGKIHKSISILLDSYNLFLIFFNNVDCLENIFHLLIYKI